MAKKACIILMIIISIHWKEKLAEKLHACAFLINLRFELVASFVSHFSCSLCQVSQLSAQLANKLELIHYSCCWQRLCCTQDLETEYLNLKKFYVYSSIYKPLVELLLQPFYSLLNHVFCSRSFIFLS